MDDIVARWVGKMVGPALGQPGGARQDAAGTAAAAKAPWG